MPSNDPVHPGPAGSAGEELGDAGTLVVEDAGFAIVGEWVITAQISDAAFRVYSMLLRFGNTSGNRMPSRALLARRLHRSVDSIDRALRELQSHGLVRVEHRHDGRQYRSNRYHVRTTPPPSSAGVRDVAVAVEESSRRSTATPRRRTTGGRRDAATPGRRTAARVAADPRPYPDPVTQKPPPPAGGSDDDSRAPAVEDLLARCGIHDLEELAARCAAARQALGRPATRWAPACLLTALQLAVVVRGWPAHLAAGALLAVAADPATRSPARLAEAGPWWDTPSHPPTTTAADDDLAALEERLAELGGQRPALQARARAELAAEHLPVTRATVTRRAIAILDRQDQPA